MTPYLPHIVLIAYALIAGVVLWVYLRRRQRLNEFLEAPIDDRNCVACGEMRVQRLAPGVYRCPTCGYEGGPGVARREAEAKRRALRSLKPEERRRNGQDALREAHRLLLAMRGDIAAYEQESDDLALVAMALPDYVPSPPPLDKLVLRVYGGIHEVHEHLETAALCFGTEYRRPDRKLFDLGHKAVQTGLFVDPEFDGVYPGDLRRLDAEVRRLTELVEERLRDAGVPFVPLHAPR